MAYSAQDIRTIHTKGSAVYNRVYKTDEGISYIGLKDGRLKLLNSASLVNFTPSQDINETNAQKAIESIKNDVNSLNTTVTNNFNTLSESVEEAKCYALVMSFIF